ncbi:hypothetical protein Tco_0285942 [Tanacetum coccineum]
MQKAIKGVIGKERIEGLYFPSPTTLSLLLRRPAKDEPANRLKEVGQWKKNCPVYLAELQKKRKQIGSASSSEGFRIERKAKQGALDLYVAMTIVPLSPTITRGVVSVSPFGLTVDLFNVLNGLWNFSFKECVLSFNAVPRKL